MDTATRPLALVTGASTGLGKVFATRLAAQGFDLLLVARDGDRLRRLGAELQEAHGASCEAWPADLVQDAEIERLLARVRAAPNLAMIVNNAGFGTMGTLARIDPVPQDAMVRLHTLAPMRLTQAALPGMIARKRGTIINVSSVASFTAGIGNVNYCATKAYLRVFSQALALEVGHSGVRVQALCPGFFYSEFHDRLNFDRGRIPAWLWMSADYVVDTSLAQAARGGDTVCVPGWQYKVIVFALRYLSWAIGPLQRRYRRD